MTIEVTEREDGSFDISWDENDPTESILNTWTEQDFIDCIKQEDSLMRHSNLIINLHHGSHS
jgi:hypothetical protein